MGAMGFLTADKFLADRMVIVDKYGQERRMAPPNNNDGLSDGDDGIDVGYMGGTEWTLVETDNEVEVVCNNVMPSGVSAALANFNDVEQSAGVLYVDGGVHHPIE